MIKQLSAMAIAVLCLGAISCEKDKEEEKVSSETQDSRLMGSWRMDSVVYQGGSEPRVDYGVNMACEEITDPDHSVAQLDFTSQLFTSTDCYLIYNSNTEEYELNTLAFPSFWITDNDTIYTSFFSATVNKEDANTEYYSVNGNKLIIVAKAVTFGDTLKTQFYTKL